MIARINADGRITIPAAARRRLGLKPKSVVRLEVRDDHIAVKPVKSIADLGGILREYAEGKTTDWDTIREEMGLAVAREVMEETGD